MSEVARVTACGNQQQEGGWVCVSWGGGWKGRGWWGWKKKKEKKTALGENILLLHLRECSYLNK